MEDLLPYYERELGFLRRYSREFSERYPKIAGRLQMGGEVCEDPHIERMIESFALLNSRIAKRLDDDYPEFTDALFEVLYPHYLRPFPSCSIARLDYREAAAQLTRASVVPRDTQLKTHPVNGEACLFRTTYPVTVAPLALTHASFNPIIRTPEAVRTPAGATSSVSVTMATPSHQVSVAQLGVGKLRVFIDGEPSFCAALRDALFMRTVCAYAEADDSGCWTALGAIPVSVAGFDDDESLIEFSARSHTAYRLLTEYFTFPEKFNFFDIDVTAICAALPAGAHRVTLHLAMSGMRSDSNAARMLGTLGTHNLVLGCTPVVNLFKQATVAVRAASKCIASIRSSSYARPRRGKLWCSFARFTRCSMARPPKKAVITTWCGATMRSASVVQAMRRRFRLSTSISIRLRLKPTPSVWN